MRPHRCTEERDPTDALTSRSRVASPQAGPPAPPARAHLVPVRALPEADFAGFPTACGVSTSALEQILFGVADLSHDLTGQDTSQTNEEEGA